MMAFTNTRIIGARVMANAVGVLVTAVWLYVLTLASMLFGLLVAWAITGYSPPEQPLNSDYLEPDSYGLIFALIGPYAFWVLVVAGCRFTQIARPGSQTTLKQHWNALTTDDARNR
jgi:hypothetical protein